jgi:hypothetical protein
MKILIKYTYKMSWSLKHAPTPNGDYKKIHIYKIYPDGKCSSKRKIEYQVIVNITYKPL